MRLVTLECGFRVRRLLWLDDDGIHGRSLLLWWVHGGSGALGKTALDVQHSTVIADCFFRSKSISKVHFLGTEFIGRVRKHTLFKVRATSETDAVATHLGLVPFCHDVSALLVDVCCVGTRIWEILHGDLRMVGGFRDHVLVSLE